MILSKFVLAASDFVCFLQNAAKPGKGKSPKAGKKAWGAAGKKVSQGNIAKAALIGGAKKAAAPGKAGKAKLSSLF